MTVYIASKTLAAIETAIVADQGGKFRTYEKLVISTLDDAFRGEDEGFRTHLGASLAGRQCPRELWYSFRWALKKKFESRILRLFNRGHLEEGRFIAMLLAAGVKFYQQDADGKQFRVAWAEGHCGGSGDGFAVDIPDLPAGQTCVCEFKTHNDASFKKLVKSGVKEAKLEHWVQMNIYMVKFNIPYALYMAVNKNDDSIYAELIVVDPEAAQQYIDRAEAVVWAESPPAKVANSAGWFVCKFCDYKGICHNQDEPSVNCRTCEHSQPVANGQWVCKLSGTPAIIPKELQLTGCQNYVKKETF